MQGAPNRKSNGTTKQWFTQWTTENQQNIPSAESTVLTQSRALYVTLHHFWFAHSSQKQHKTLHLGNYPHNCYFTFSLVKRYFRSGRTLVQERQWWSRWPRQQALPPWRPTMQSILIIIALITVINTIITIKAPLRSAWLGCLSTL